MTRETDKKAHQQLFRIVDGLLPMGQADEICNMVDRYPVHTVVGPGKHTLQSVVPIWTTTPYENPKRSREVFVWTEKNLVPQTVSRLSGAPLTVCPSGTALDNLFEAVLAQARLTPELVGAENSEWAGIVARVYSYGVGARAKWHTDDVIYTGAFIYYTSRHWHEDWGGDLLVENDADINQGAYIRPKQNRLVLIRGGTRHSVSRVLPEAANATRRSVAGFFATIDLLNHMGQTVEGASSEKSR